MTLRHCDSVTVWKGDSVSVWQCDSVKLLQCSTAPPLPGRRQVNLQLVMAENMAGHIVNYTTCWPVNQPVINIMDGDEVIPLVWMNGRYAAGHSLALFNISNCPARRDGSKDTGHVWERAQCGCPHSLYISRLGMSQVLSVLSQGPPHTQLAGRFQGLNVNCKDADTF